MEKINGDRTVNIYSKQVATKVKIEDKKYDEHGKVIVESPKEI